jgi:signal transduction histidine kinase
MSSPAVVPSSPFAAAGASIRVALEASRARMARTSDRVRVVGVTAFWLLHFVAGRILGLRNWRGNLDLWTIYLVLAALVVVLAPRLPRLAPRTVRLIPALDMPMLFFLTDRLAPLGNDPSAVVGFMAGGYVLFILWSAMALEPRLTVVAALMAGALEATLFHRIGSDPAGLVASVLLMGLAGFLTVYVTDRLGAAMTGLTEAKVRREEAERSMAEKDRFVSTVSHDFRTPLAVILTALQTLEDNPNLSSEERRGFLEGAIRQCRRMMTMSEELLRLARLGSRPPARARVALERLAEDTVASLRPRASDAGVRLETAKGRLEVEVEVEAALIERALVNLVDNALRHAPRGSAVTVRVEPQGDWAIIQVDDRGPGVAAADRERIFEPFHRGGPSSGSGLGLAIVREVARAHGGRAVVVDAPEGGARFVMTLPLARRGT